MKKNDIFRMCIQNLRRRKSRTFLTILGVLIGCCSIVIMISLGIGMKESAEKNLAEMGDLMIITVTAPQGGRGKLKADEALVKSIRAISGVVAVTPKQSLEEYTCRLLSGTGNRYVADWTIVAGLDTAELGNMGYKLIDGKSVVNSGEIIVGQYFPYNFKDTLRPEGSNFVSRWGGSFNEYGKQMNIPEAYFNPLKEKITLEVESETEKFTVLLTPVGVTKEDYSKGYETAEGIIMSLTDIKNIIDKAQGNKKKNLPYDSVIVKVSELSMVEQVDNEIKNLGYNTESMESSRKTMEKEAHQKQMMLGGLGAISLFVAALGITNTMIMSISERTREIGIMKSLGCYVYDIRIMFLTEAGIIGLIGGIIGCIISFLISVIINCVSLGSLSLDSLRIAIMGGEGINRISVIPIWLLAFSILFSVLIGLGSGYYPANKAVQIPALEAIKNE